MNSLSTHAGSRRRHVGAIAWTNEHQGTTTVVAIAAAVLAGVLLGLLFSVASPGTESISLHRAGGHATATVAQAERAVAVVSTAVGHGTTTALHITSTRSPARGGFAVGRAQGAGSGFIVIDVGTRAPVRGGFAGRSLGIGNRS
jgi:hypothetical protein